MRKKILCLAISMIMAVGALTGCGSSSGGISKKVESTILTEITPGKSTWKDVKKYYDTNGITYDGCHGDNKRPCRTTNTGIFLGHEYCVVSSDYTFESDVIYGYSLEVYFKDVEGYQNGLSEVDDYLKSMSLGITAIDEYEDGEYAFHYFLVEDNDDYMTYLCYYPDTYENDGDEHDEDEYYNTCINVFYLYTKGDRDSDEIKWKDSKGNKYTPKYIRNNISSTEATESTESIKREDSTESIYREDSTEVSQQENSNSTAGKQAYDVEEEVNKIRDIYYWVQGDSSNLTKQDGGSVTRWIDSNGKIRKIVAPAGTYDDTNGAGAAKYNAEFYYNENEELVFVFLYSGKEEHRLYVMQGKCVRYIDQDKSINDYPELKEADRVCDLGYFIGLGMMEIHYAHV